jgi:hypothetical protein
MDIAKEKIALIIEWYVPRLLINSKGALIFLCNRVK